MKKNPTDSGKKNKKDEEAIKEREERLAKEKQQRQDWEEQQSAGRARLNAIQKRKENCVLLIEQQMANAQYKDLVYTSFKISSACDLLYQLRDEYRMIAFSFENDADNKLIFKMKPQSYNQAHLYSMSDDTIEKAENATYYPKEEELRNFVKGFVSGYRSGHDKCREEMYKQMMPFPMVPRF